MKFVLNNARRAIADDDLLNDLRRVANNLAKHSLKQRDYNKSNGANFNIKTAIARFGNWDAVLKNAGLQGEKSLKGIEYGDKEIKEKELIDDLRRVAQALNKEDITTSEYNQIGQYTATTMAARFGSWNRAKERAKLEVTRKLNNSTDDLFQNIVDLWTVLGRQPKFADIVRPQSRFHGSTYARRFGSWAGALQEFVEYMNAIDDTSKIIENKPHLIPLIDSDNKALPVANLIKVKKTTRNINLRLRWTILKRDNFSCTKCGSSPAKDSSVILHVDHVLAWSRGGETVIENLETLCQKCNLGKSNS